MSVKVTQLRRGLLEPLAIWRLLHTWPWGFLGMAQCGMLKPTLGRLDCSLCVSTVFSVVSICLNKNLLVPANL